MGVCASQKASKEIVFSKAVSQVEDKQASVETAKSVAPAETPASGDSNFIQSCLDVHNKYRALHGCPPLKWDGHCADMAKDWLDNTVGPKMALIHGGKDEDMGQNLYNTMTSVKTDTPPPDIIAQATKAWYDEITDFDFSDPGGPGRGTTGHFTQVVWKETTHVGLAVWCKAGVTFVCANYLPQGNLHMAGEKAETYGRNVPALK